MSEDSQAVHRLQAVRRRMQQLVTAIPWLRVQIRGSFQRVVALNEAYYAARDAQHDAQMRRLQANLAAGRLRSPAKGDDQVPNQERITGLVTKREAQDMAKLPEARQA